MEDRKKMITLTVLLLFFLFGLYYVREAGVCFDESSEQRILAMNLRQYGDTLHLERLSDYFRNRDIIPICESVERDHGIAPYYPFAVALHHFEHQPEFLSLFWHAYTYLLFFLGVVYLYRLLYELFENNRTALLGTAVFFFTPRIFADGLYNNKDTVLLSLVLVMLFYGIRFIERKDFKSALLLGISAGFAGNMKISGLYVFAMVGLFYLIELTRSKKWSVRTFLVGVTAAGMGFFCYLLLTPAIWGEGFHLAEFISWNLFNVTNFSRLDGTVLFEGSLYRHSDNPLPWYYIPQIILLTIPIYISVLIISSLVLWCRNLKKGGKAQRLYPLFALSAGIPVAVAMCSTPNIYNGWRHFYFIYGPMAVMAAYPLHALLLMGKKGTEKVKRVLTAGVGICLAVNIVGIAATGIFSVAYTNLLAGGNAEGRYEMDYYGVATKKIMMELAEEYDLICLHSDSAGAAIINQEVLPEKYREKIFLMNTEEGKRLAEENGEAVFYYVNPTYDLDDTSELETVREYKAWGNTFARLCRKK